MRCDACGERIDLFKHTLNYRVLVGFPQRSFAAQACSAEFVCFCTCDLQTRHCDQAVADRLGNSIGYQSYFSICAGASGGVAIASSVRTRRHRCRPTVAFRAKAGRWARASRGRSPWRMFMPGSARPADGMPKPLRIQTLRSAAVAQRQTHRCLHLGELAGEASGRMTSNQM